MTKSCVSFSNADICSLLPFFDGERSHYTAKQWDEDAQLYYFNARWYDPNTARFITEDPIRDGLLWYAYCNNNPLKFTDPTGLRPARGTNADDEDKTRKDDEEREKEREEEDDKDKKAVEKIKDWEEENNLTFQQKLEKLGPYGDPRKRDVPKMTPENYTDPRIIEETYTDKSIMAAVGQYLKSFGSESDNYGNTGVVTADPIITSGVMNFGDLTLTTYDNKRTPGLDGYDVSHTLDKSVTDGYEGTLLQDNMQTYEPTVLPESEGNYALENSEFLVDQALGNDNRSKVQIFIDNLFD